MNGLSPKEAQDVLSMAEILEIPGFDMMQGILEGIYPAAPISKILNYNVHAVEKGKVIFRGTPNLESRNPMGTIHGGWYGTILDSAMACAVMTTLQRHSHNCGSRRTTASHLAASTIACKPLQELVAMFDWGLSGVCRILYSS